MVSAMSPTAPWHSSNSQSSSWAYSMANWRSSLDGTAWRGLPPARQYTAHAAFSGAALLKYCCSASSLRLVAVVSSSSA